ncbi:hypothetical protein [Nonomuraea solani]|nr:hypothetical protein [Nonomuraea solani]
MNELGVDRAEAGQIAAAVQCQYAPRNLAGCLGALAKSGDLADFQGHVRGRASRQQARLAPDDRRTRPCCPHGEAGGVDLNPRSGRPWCPLCRIGAAADIEPAPTGAGP